MGLKGADAAHREAVGDRAAGPDGAIMPEGYRPDNELEMLFPDREVTVRDPDTGAPVALTLREFRFREGLEATALARPLVAALAALVPNDGRDGAPDAHMIEAALADHADLWLTLAACACDRDAAWLARLGDADGHALSEAMWAANGAFFLRRVVARVAALRRLPGQETCPFPSTACSTPSSAPATGAAISTSQSA